MSDDNAAADMRRAYHQILAKHDRAAVQRMDVEERVRALLDVVERRHQAAALELYAVRHALELLDAAVDALLANIPDDDQALAILAATEAIRTAQQVVLNGRKNPT